MACGVDNFFFGCLQAVEFVNMQHDDELWEELIKQCLNKPEMVYTSHILPDNFANIYNMMPSFPELASINGQVGVLLEHTVGNLDPLYIVNMVPNGLEIPRLVLTEIFFLAVLLYISSFMLCGAVVS